jgi:NADH-quinone oxidoreductase subunit G
MSLSRLDKFGTDFDSWAKKNKHDAKASWKILSHLSSFFAVKLKYNLAEDVFADISKSIDAFKGLDYDVIGDPGAKLKIAIPENSVEIKRA